MISGLEAFEAIYGLAEINCEENSPELLRIVRQYKEIVKQTLLQKTQPNESKTSCLEIIERKGLDFHSVSVIKKAENYEEYLKLVENLVTMVYKLNKDEFTILKKEMTEK